MIATCPLGISSKNSEVFFKLSVFLTLGGRWQPFGASMGEKRVDFLITLVGSVLEELASSSRLARWLLMALTLGIVLAWIFY